jgi:hypothetical protein
MAIKISGALRDHLLTAGSLYAAVNGMVLRIYAGVVPASPEADVSGNTLLCTISTNSLGTGLAFESAPVNGMLSKAAAGIWSGAAVADGAATFYRLGTLSDTAAASTTAKRIQGTVGLAGADLNVTDINFTTAEEKRIDYFVVGMLTG